MYLTVIASEAKQAMALQNEIVDCFASLAMTVAEPVAPMSAATGTNSRTDPPIAALIRATGCFTAAKPAMHAPLLPEDHRLTPDNDPTPAPFGAFAPNAAQAAIISLAHRSRLKRGAFRPMLSRLVNLLRAGSGRRAVSGRRRSASTTRPAPPSAARCSIPTTTSRSWIFCARMCPQAACSSMSAPMSAPMRWRWRGMSAPTAR